MLKSFRSLVLHSHIMNSKVSSSKKEKAKAKKPKTSVAVQIMEMDALKNFGFHIKCTTPSGSIFTDIRKCWAQANRALRDLRGPRPLRPLRAPQASGSSEHHFLML